MNQNRKTVPLSGIIALLLTFISIGPGLALGAENHARIDSRMILPEAGPLVLPVSFISIRKSLVMETSIPSPLPLAPTILTFRMPPQAVLLPPSPPPPEIIPVRLPPNPTINTTAVVAVSPSSYEEWISKYSTQNGVNPQTLRKIAECESGMQPNAVNGQYGGMFQYHPTTWESARKEMNKDTNPDLRYDAEEAIATAAHTLATQGTHPWPVCGA